MRLGIAIQDTWDFFREVFTHLEEYHQVSLFEPRRYPYQYFQSRINKFLFYKDLRKFMRSCDVAYFEWASELLAMATRLPKRSGIVTRLHRFELYEWADKVNWDAVDRVIVVSEAKRREFLSQYPVQNGKVVVIPEAISIRKFIPRHADFTGEIGIMSHLTPRKRVYDLVLTFYELQQVRNDLRLHIAGGPRPAYGDYSSALKHLVDELELNDKVIFHGHVDDTPTWYQSIDIFISNSYSEGLQVSPIEAMASGCYCLAHRWDGADELLPKEYLYYTNNEMKAKILAYCDMPEADKALHKKRMREIAERKFDVDQIKHLIRETIEEVYRKGQGSGASVK
jgi:glycosyltransferase involved in cell wall biosynthesis